uniref:M42 family peptidase n=1 Tax=candidate division WOR-3 bacterium TaxID=2052148 RepID=A0A7C4XU39_UNCW3
MLRELCELIGVSGDEEMVKDYLKNSISDEVDEIVEDTYGNLIVRKGKGKIKVMLVAHMDEVGFMITGINKNGLLRFKTIGIPPAVMLAKRVIIGKHRIIGVVGNKPAHFVNDEEGKKKPEEKSLFIDIGVNSKEEAEKFVEIGETGTFDTDFYEDDNLFMGRALDNRIGCFVLSQLIKNTDLPCYYAFTTQEEVGLRGAKIVGYRISPDVAIAVDTTGANEFPTEKDVPQYPVLGSGPVITIADYSIICSQKLVSLIVQTAVKNNIPYQYKQPMVGGTDAGSVHLVKGGIPSAVISTPARYIHSPLAIAAKLDVNQTISLLAKGVEEIIKKGRSGIN